MASPVILMWLMWYFKSPRELSLLVIDKTVLNDQVQEHMSLFWVLINEKYTRPGNIPYHPLKDYYGLFPDGRGGFHVNDFENMTIDELDSLSDVYNATFYTDLYGVYLHEWIEEYEEYLEGNEWDDPERNRLIYGGFTNKEMTFLKMMKEKEKLIIVEFNTLQSARSHSIRRDFQDEFGVSWTGWIGRYFDVLDTTINNELPQWVINNYLKYNNGLWPFENSGIVFARGDRVVILENHTHLDIEVPLIRTAEEYTEKYGVIKEVRYPFWFDIVVAEEPNQIISNYHIIANDAGDSLLKRFDIPEIFPATIHHKDGYLFYYLAGDFSDNPLNMRSSNFRYVHLISSMFYTNEPIDREGFFWRYYRPLIKTVLEHQYKTISRHE